VVLPETYLAIFYVSYNLCPIVESHYQSNSIRHSGNIRIYTHVHFSIFSILLFLYVLFYSVDKNHFYTYINVTKGITQTSEIQKFASFSMVLIAPKH